MKVRLIGSHPVLAWFNVLHWNLAPKPLKEAQIAEAQTYSTLTF